MKYLTIAAVFAATPAMAQVPCIPAGEFEAWIAEEMDQHLTVEMLEFTGGLIQIYTSSDGKWSAVKTTPDGPTCYLTEGSFFQTSDGPPLGEEG